MIEKKPIHRLFLENVNVSYEDESVLKDINVELPSNTIVNIRGVRGSGKSTILRVIAGLISPTQGQYRINDDVVSDMSFEEFLPYRLNMGFGFDYGGLINNITILDNLMLPLTYHNLLSFEKARERAFEYLELFNLHKIFNKRPAEISGGMKKETCVIRSFLTHPEVLLLDDPTTGMSSESKIVLKALIKEKMKMGTLKHVFLVSDDDDFLDQFQKCELLLQNDHLRVVS